MPSLGRVFIPLFLASLATAQTCYWPDGKVATGYTSCNEASQISNSSLGRVFIPLFLASLATAQTCYWPDGKVATGYTSCNEASQISNCCNQDSVCLSNGFCLNQKSFGNRLLRGACTDKSWGAGCQQICKDTFPSSQSSLILTGDFDPGTFCCGNVVNGKCAFASAGSNDPFRGPGCGAVIWNRKTGSSDWSLLANATTTTSSAKETVTVTVAATGTSVPLSGSGNLALDKTCPKDNTVAVGTGVGAGLGVTLAVVVGLLVMQIRRRKDAERQLEEMALVPPAHYDVGVVQSSKGSASTGYIPVESRGQVSELHGNYVGRPGTPEMKA